MEWQTDVADAAVELLPEVLRVPRFESFLKVVLRRHQGVEDALRTLQEGWWFANASGVQLDGFGELLLLPRGARGDAEYRLHLQAQVKLLRGNGTPEDVLGLFLLLCPAPLTLSLAEEYPAALRLRVGGGVVPLPLSLASILQQAKPAGVRALLEYYAVVPDGTLTLAAVDGTGTTLRQRLGSDWTTLGARESLFDPLGTTGPNPTLTITDVAAVSDFELADVRVRIPTAQPADAAAYDYSLDGGTTWLPGFDSTDTTPHNLTVDGDVGGTSVGLQLEFPFAPGTDYVGVEVWRWEVYGVRGKLAGVLGRTNGVYASG